MTPASYAILYCYDQNIFGFFQRQEHIPIRICRLHEWRGNKMVELRPIGLQFKIADHDFGTKAFPEPANKISYTSMYLYIIFIC